MGKIVLLTSKATSGQTWSPLQLLEEFVQAVHEGKEVPVRLMLCWTEARADGSVQRRRWQAGCSIAEEIAFHEAAKLDAIEDWKA